jgi:hypothetical protein
MPVLPFLEGEFLHQFGPKTASKTVEGTRAYAYKAGFALFTLEGLRPATDQFLLSQFVDG